MPKLISIDLTDPDVMAWQAENRRLAAEGWSLGATIGLDGTVRDFASKGEQTIERPLPPQCYVDDDESE